jgi:hypothetical protein
MADQKACSDSHSTLSPDLVRLANAPRCSTARHAHPLAADRCTRRAKEATKRKSVPATKV